MKKYISYLILVLLILGSLFKIKDIINLYYFDLNQLHGKWKCTDLVHSSFGEGSFFNMGDYQVNYILIIHNDNSYELYYGSPKFEKLNSEGKLDKKIWDGICLTNFLSKINIYYYIISNVRNRDGVIQTVIVEDNQNNDFHDHLEFYRL